MPFSDADFFKILERHGIGLGELFLVGDEIYVSDDAGDFQHWSTYQPFPTITPQEKDNLRSWLIRRESPQYESLCEVDDVIAKSAEWESLYVEIRDALAEYGRHAEGGAGDFFVVDEDYGYAQVKIECITDSFFTHKIATRIQSVLKHYSRRWEVIVCWTEGDSKTVTRSIFANEMQ